MFRYLPKPIEHSKARVNPNVTASFKYGDVLKQAYHLYTSITLIRDFNNKRHVWKCVTRWEVFDPMN